MKLYLLNFLLFAAIFNINSAGLPQNIDNNEIAIIENGLPGDSEIIEESIYDQVTKFIGLKKLENLVFPYFDKISELVTPTVIKLLYFKEFCI